MGQAIETAFKVLREWFWGAMSAVFGFAIFVCLLFPIFGLIITFIADAFSATPVNFGWALSGGGVSFQPTMGLKLLAFPIGVMTLLLLIHAAESIAASRPGEPSFAMMENLGQNTLLFYGPAYLIWALTARSLPWQNHIPWAILLGMAFTVYVLAKGKIVYGQHRQVARVNQATQVAQTESAVARRQVPALRFKDIYGNAEIKRRLLEAGQAIAKPTAGKATRNGILLFGEPGNGKTVFAEALAGELGMPFLQLTHSDVASQWVGERSVRIRAAFEQARQAAPCLLFIDEIDSFIPDRTNATTSNNKEDQDVVNALLTLLVDIRKHKVVVVAATNFVDRLDAAATREGRFDFKVEITPPDQEARIGLLTHGLKKNLPKMPVDAEVVKTVASRWNGYSVKRILAVTEEMPSYLDDLAEKGNKPASLGYENFMAALRRIQGRKGATPENVKAMADMILPEVTREAIDMLAARLRDPQRVERLGGSLPSGVLFYGPPGTGKTATCKALTKEVGWAFLIATGTDLARDPRALDKLYAQAKELRPAIIFIDEADDLLRSREYSTSTEATNKLLTLMDGVNDRVRDVVWVAATNHPDQIDAALLRGGRFTEKVEFVRPDESQLTGHIAKWLEERKVVLAEGLTPGDVAALMGEESIANAEAVLQYAVNRAISTATSDAITVSAADMQRGVGMVLGSAA